QLALAVAQLCRAGVGVVRQAEALQEGGRPLAFRRGDAPPQQAADGEPLLRADDVLDHRETREQTRQLVGASEPGVGSRRAPPALEPAALYGDPTGLGSDRAVDEVEERGLAGAVRADETGDAA